MPADPPDITIPLSEDAKPTVHMTAANADLFGGESPAPSEEGMPPARYEDPLPPVEVGRPLYCPPCARTRCPARRMPSSRRLPFEWELDWTHPIRGAELRNTLSRWLLVAAVAGSAVFWGGLFLASVAP